MKSWTVTARGLASVQVEGSNWIVALGRGLEELDRVGDLSRLACEVLPNGTVIARDIASGTGYVVQSLGDTNQMVPALGEQSLPLVEDDEPLGEVPTASVDDGFDPYEDDAMDAIDAATSEPQACKVALDAAVARVSAESGAILLDERGYLRFSAVVGPHSAQLEGVRLPAGTGIAGYAITSRRSVVISNAQEDPRHFSELDARTGYATRQMAVIPILEGDRVLGVIEVMNRDEGAPGRFVEADVSAIEEVAAALAARLLR